MLHDYDSKSSEKFLCHPETGRFSKQVAVTSSVRGEVQRSGSVGGGEALHAAASPSGCAADELATGGFAEDGLRNFSSI